MIQTYSDPQPQDLVPRFSPFNESSKNAYFIKQIPKIWFQDVPKPEATAYGFAASKDLHAAQHLGKHTTCWKSLETMWGTSLMGSPGRSVLIFEIDFIHYEW